MRKSAPLLILILLSTAFGAWSRAETDCTSVEDCAAKMEKYSSKLAKIRSQQSTIDSQIKDYLTKLTVTDAQIESLKKDIIKVSEELKIIESNLADRRGSLDNKIQVRNTIVRDFYKSGRPGFLDVLSTGQFFALRDIFEDRIGGDTVKSIISLNMEITNFESDKAEAAALRASLEESQRKLLSLKADIDRQKQQAQSQYAQLDATGDSYEKAIAELSARQQEILAEKSGGDNGSVGDYEPPKASLPTPKFSPAFAGISYGAYTHYKGMSQYGAKGRAEAGQDYKAILKFYYKADVKKVSGFPSKISVSGYGNLDFQYYLYGIAEMPSSWPSNGLKAQAIAARSYAYRYAKNGTTICTTQSCQVFLASKAKSPPAAWKKAVDDTKAMVLDGDVVAYYSSTTGGYIENIGWDVSGNWPNGAYEKKAGSPWFYKAWYTKSYNDSSTCGRSDPYLTEKEMADILNAVTVWEKGGSSDRNKISPVTTSCWGGSPYSLDKMKSRAEELGTAYSGVTSVDVEIGTNGRTSKVVFGTDKGSITIDGEKFRTVFNLRAPGYISLKDRLYEIVKK